MKHGACQIRVVYVVGLDGAEWQSNGMRRSGCLEIRQMLMLGVVIGGDNPYLDPDSYRLDLIFQLATDYYSKPTLYNERCSMGHSRARPCGNRSGRPPRVEDHDSWQCPETSRETLMS